MKWKSAVTILACALACTTTDASAITFSYTGAITQVAHLSTVLSCHPMRGHKCAHVLLRDLTKVRHSGLPPNQNLAGY